MRIEIAEATPTLNVLMRKFVHKHAKARERNRWHYLVREQVGPPNGDAMAKCEITVTRFGGNDVDWDNLAAGCKFLLDALVSNGVITDDAPKVVKRFQVEQQIDRANPRTVVEIKPI